MDSRRTESRPAQVLPPSFRKVLVLGLGKVTGAAVARAMTDLGLEVRVAESVRSEANVLAAEELARIGAEVVFDDQDPALVEWADLLVPSPGVPPWNASLEAAGALGVPVLSEIEVGWRLAKGPVLAITGTNGKTTCTELLTSMLKAASLPAVAAGNIGLPLVKAAGEVPDGTIFVTEVSSFQLAYIDTFRPRVAIVLNVADDHLDWHGSPGEYVASKARITEKQEAGDLLLVSAGDPAAMSIAAGSKARIGVFGAALTEELRRRARERLGREPALVAGVSDGRLILSSSRGDVQVAETSDIRLAGAHNLENVLAASAAAFDWHGRREPIQQAVRAFKGLPHRMHLVAEKNHIRYIDDSKATNPHAALAAMKGMNDVILIAGGRSKGISLSPLRQAASSLKAVVVMGEAAGELEEVFDQVPVHHAESVEEAVRKAAGLAGAGDTVLLSPGCSSLDQYSNYAERGDRFVRAVRDMA